MPEKKKKPATTFLRELFRDALDRARSAKTVLNRLDRALPKERLSPKSYGDSVWIYSILLGEPMPSAVRTTLVERIGVLGQYARWMAEKLIAFLESDDRELVERTIVALSKIKCTTPPVLTALVIAGRVGAGITAEIGSMKVTEQIDAMRSMGVNPTQKLVIPRLIALMVMLPLLTILADFVGVLGGLFISVTELDVSGDFYVNTIIQFIRFQDLLSGLGKTFCFAFFIATIACYNGLQASGGADGVGRATTQTVVIASITILVSDFFLTKLFLQL